MTLETYSDAARQTFSDISIVFAGADITQYVVFAETSFDLVAGAQPGTCSISLRGAVDQNGHAGSVESVFAGHEGGVISLTIDGIPMWTGFGTVITRGYWFPNVAEPKYVLQGVDLNILFDRLIIYNHDDPTKWPTGGGAYITATTKLKPGGVPRGENSRDFLVNSLKDTDINTVGLKTNLIGDIGIVFPDDNGSTLSAGATLRALFEEASSEVVSTEQGSVIWYIDPEYHLVFVGIDDFSAPWAVSDNPSGGVACKNLSVVTDASHLKNDVLIFAGSLDPQAESKQKYLHYKHNSLAASVTQYGRFQYSETLPGWTQLSVNARSTKILFQEGTPGMRATFTVYRAGLIPGQIMTLNTIAFSGKLPVRQVSIGFDSPNLANYQVTCSFDTNDPWGVLLALKRPASRGLIQPKMQSLFLKPGDDPPYAEIYTHVEEQPEALGGNIYKCSYSYIRFSLVVYVKGSHAIRALKDPGAVSTDAFIETDPDKGLFKIFPLTGGGTIQVAYHVAANT
jgi:hypothetical protein